MSILHMQYKKPVFCKEMFLWEMWNKTWLLFQVSPLLNTAQLPKPAVFDIKNKITPCIEKKNERNNYFGSESKGLSIKK